MFLRHSLNAAAALLAFAASAMAQEVKPALGLMGTIPIYWGEPEGLSDSLGQAPTAHWARKQLEAGYDLRPLDKLDEADLASLDYLLLAQPRALTPAENVALDAWVREGGRLLLFADPMLTGHTRFAIGDRRRPQDVILLSPLLEHWGLQLAFYVERPEGNETVMIDSAAVPINRPGRFTAAGDPGNCSLDAEGLLAVCRLGEGMATVLADAAVLDLERQNGAAALDWLVGRSLRPVGDIAGSVPNDESAGR